MHKYEELEKLYYKRKYTKYFIVSMIVIFSIVCLFFIKSYDQNEKKIIKNDKVKTIQKTDNSEKKVKQIIKVTKKIEDNITQKIVKKEIKSEKRVKKLVLYPIFPDIDTNKTAEEIKPKIKPKIKSQSKIQVEEKSIQKDDTKHSLKIVVKSVKTVNDLIYIYQKSPTYENAMKISKRYFNKEEYAKSIEWAKKANKIDPEDYESWYIFAKSLIKLEKKDKAKKVLIAYLKTYGPDKNIEELLRSIK